MKMRLFVVLLCLSVLLVISLAAGGVGRNSLLQTCYNEKQGEYAEII